MIQQIPQTCQSDTSTPSFTTPSLDPYPYFQVARPPLSFRVLFWHIFGSVCQKNILGSNHFSKSIEEESKTIAKVICHPNVPWINNLNRLHVTFANWPSVVAVTAALVGSQSALQKEHSVGEIGCTSLISY